MTSTTTDATLSSAATASEAYRAALSRAGVEQFSIHSLRQVFDG